MVRLGLAPTKAEKVMVRIVVQIVVPLRGTLDQAPRRNRPSHPNLAKVVRGVILETILEAGRRRDMVAMVAVIPIKAMLVKITVMDQQGVIIVEELPKAAAEVISPKETVSRVTL